MASSGREGTDDSKDNGRRREGTDDSKDNGRRSDGRAALYGLLGALFGGLFSFAGTYFSLSEAHRNQFLDQEQSAFVAFSTRANQYVIDLIELDQVVAARNLAEYKKVRVRLVQEVAPLDAQYETMSVLTKGGVVKAAAAVQANLYDVFVPLDAKKLDRKKLQTILDKSDGLQTKYLEEARRHLEQDRQRGRDLFARLLD